MGALRGVLVEVSDELAGMAATMKAALRTMDWMDAAARVTH